MTVAPETVRIGDDRPARDLRRRVDRVLGGSGLVALPTETVYGIAARADDPRAIAALRQLKGRADAAFTWHVGRPTALEAFPRVSPLVRRLTARYWPGPLTLVLPGVPAGLGEVAQDGWTGVRLPAHLGTASLLEALAYPVVMTSANARGEPPLTTAHDVAEALGSSLELVVDGGPSRMGEASGVLRVGEGRFELVREGLLPIDDLRRTAGLRIAFVCTGNTCRSPMAEGLARLMLEERLGLSTEGELADFGFEVASMGVMAGAGGRPSAHACSVLADHGYDLSHHRSSPAIPERILEMDRVYCLTRAHRDALESLLPPGRARHIRLLDPSGEDVPDPIGGDREVYRRCADHIATCLRAFLDDWA